MVDKEITQAGGPLVITYLLYLPGGFWGGPTPLTSTTGHFHPGSLDTDNSQEQIVMKTSDFRET